MGPLPADILKLIFELLPQRPRLLVVSRVCKHWRSLVLLTGFSLPPGVDPKRFACITSAEVQGDNPLAVDVFAHSLRHLTVRWLSEAQLASLTRRATLLTYLRLDNMIRPVDVELVAASSAILTELLMQGINGDISKTLQPLCLPHLKKLSLYFNTVNESQALPCKFISMHTSITDLTISDSFLNSSQAFVEQFWHTLAYGLRSMPQVAYLSLQYCTCSEDTFFELTSKFPPTVRVNLAGAKYMPLWLSYTRPFPASVTSLSLTWAEGSPVLSIAALLSLFPNLTNLSMEFALQEMCEELAALSQKTALIKLNTLGGVTPAMIPLLCSFPRLRSTRIELQEPILAGILKSLSSLTVMFSGKSSPRHMLALLPSLPALRHLSIWVPKSDDALCEAEELIKAVMPRLETLYVGGNEVRGKTVTEETWERLLRMAHSDPWIGPPPYEFS